MNIFVDKTETRGHANYGWLVTYHSFSFSSYYNQKKMGFGLLRVLNDDTVATGSGFGLHSHNNMEIVSIPIKGALKHTDNTGTTEVIAVNDVQIMSAGSFIQHSESNNSDTEPVNFFQLWIQPNELNTEPSYSQMTFDPLGRKNAFQTIVSPSGENSLKIKQNAWLSLISPDSGKNFTYKMNNNNNGVYLMVIDGEIEIAGNRLGRRDAAGITETESFTFRSTSNSFLLIIETPMSHKESDR